MAVSKKSLKGAELKKKLKTVPEWNVNAKETELSRTFGIPSFVTGLSLVARIAVHAEVMGHHPDIELSYSKLKVRLSTHDVKGLTNADFELAKRIDNIGLA